MGNKKTTEYYVWEMKKRPPSEPLRELGRKRHTELEAAKEFARSRAAAGKHDVAVSGRPNARDFRLLARFAAGSGEPMPVSGAAPEPSPPPGPLELPKHRRPPGTAEERAEHGVRRRERDYRVPSRTEAHYDRGPRRPWNFDPHTGQQLASAIGRFDGQEVLTRREPSESREYEPEFEFDEGETAPLNFDTDG